MAAPITFINSRNILFSLPDELLFNIFNYLDYTDLVSCCLTCHRLHQIACVDSLWRWQCKTFWNQDVCTDGKSWKTLFRDLFLDYGRYIDIYVPIKNAWNVIETYMQKHCPSIYSTIQAGLTDSELDILERQLKERLPDDVRCTYRIHNGQQLNNIDLGLMGSTFTYDGYMCEILLGLDNAIRLMQGLDAVIEHCLPITFCHNRGLMQFIALSDVTGYVTGQIFYPIISLCGIDITDNFLAGNSFQEWFTSYAHQLAEDVFPRDSQHVLRLHHEPSFEATTGAIRVSVATCFVPERSTIKPAAFHFGYQITMSMSEDAPESEACILTTTYKTEIDEDGKERRDVSPEGLDVNFTPGAKCSWISHTSFKTTYGHVKLRFIMCRLSNPEATFEVNCPIFHMRCLPYQTAKDRMERVLQRKKNL